MIRSCCPPNVVLALSCSLFAVAACASTPIVKPTCVISWDRSADWRIDHYKVELSVDGMVSSSSPYIVKAPATEVACREIGAQKAGSWQATIRACLKDGSCSEPSKPIKFKIVDR